MVNSVILDKFKCFAKETEIPLSDVTIMYGKNGRGKSSVSQSLLLMAQSMRKANELNELVVNGELVNLGQFEELLYNTVGTSFTVGVKAGSEQLFAEFERVEGHSTSGRISRLSVNGVERMDTISGSGDGGSNDDDSSSGVAPTSDVKILQDLKNCIYSSADRLGPQNGQKRIYTTNKIQLDPLGSNVIQVISERGVEFQHSLQQALSEIMSGAHLSVSDADSDYLELKLNSADGDASFKPVNVGYGYSYVLPVVVAAMIAESGGILVVENPEAHLHPGAQSRLARFLIKQAVSNGYQLIIESHSDHVVNGLRIAAKEGEIKSSQCLIDYFYSESDATAVRAITCDKNGTLSEYPDDFMDEWTLQLLKLV